MRAVSTFVAGSSQASHSNRHGRRSRAIARGLEQAYPDTNRNYGLLVKTAFDARLEERGPSAPSAFMLLTLAFVVLLVACANVAGLLDEPRTGARAGDGACASPSAAAACA